MDHCFQISVLNFSAIASLFFCWFCVFALDLCTCRAVKSACTDAHAIAKRPLKTCRHPSYSVVWQLVEYHSVKESVTIGCWVTSPQTTPPWLRSTHVEGMGMYFPVYETPPSLPPVNGKKCPYFRKTHNTLTRDLYVQYVMYNAVLVLVVCMWWQCTIRR